MRSTPPAPRPPRPRRSNPAGRPQRTHSRRPLALLALAASLFLCVLSALLLHDQIPAARSSPKPYPPRFATAPSEDAGPTPPRDHALAPTPDAPPAACPGPSTSECRQGDLWLVDACGDPQRKLEECGQQLCRTRRYPCATGTCSAPACDQPDEDPCEYPEQGRCEGQVVAACVAGRAHEIDCAKLGMVCSEGDEGAECVPRPRVGCSGLPRCQGDVLWWCEHGGGVQRDCAAIGARCLVLEGAHQPSCVEVRPPAADSDPTCGPCGCPLALAPEETRCDGHDDDGDGLVDEELDCGVVPVLALLASDATGDTSHSRVDVEEELARVNQLFASTGVPGHLTFALAGVEVLAEPALLELDEDELARLATSTRLAQQVAVQPGFVLPVLFTDTLSGGGGTPKVGVSTLPNGTCGGMQESVGPELGLVAVAKARSRTTLAHEIGHFLGLCHTHDQPQGAPVAAVADARGAIESCAGPCRDEGDGLCDTPYDPGPSECPYDLTCSAHCTGGDEPDATNLMSYYTECRSRFSDDQVRLMQHSLALRRGWQPCTQERCPCTLGGADCPVGMSCRLRDGGEARCTLDGPLPAAAACDSGLACGRNAMCLRSGASAGARCVRACTASTPDCRCVAAQDGLSVCVDDFQR